LQTNYSNHFIDLIERVSEIVQKIPKKFSNIENRNWN